MNDLDRLADCGAAMTERCVDIDRILAETFVARIESHCSLPSTNDRAKQCAAEAWDGLPLLILAEQQTAGRGRGGNRWWTGPGSLAFSLLLEPEVVGADRGRPPLVALAAAVAIVETVGPLVSNHQVGIHWPNDVYASGKKLAGILVEVLPDRQHVVGIGLNTNSSIDKAPAELQRTATTLLELTKQRHDQTTLLITLLQRLAMNFELLKQNPERIGRVADKMCLQHDRPLTLALGNQLFTGQCAGIAPDGALLLDTPKRQQRFYTGIVQEV
jgi:BirA family transcriptional regulator, biotin operon repressor / biotin---[acetyl-CoA-carboxylase] ligase